MIIIKVSFFTNYYKYLNNSIRSKIKNKFSQKLPLPHIPLRPHCKNSLSISATTKYLRPDVFCFCTELTFFGEITIFNGFNNIITH